MNMLRPTIGILATPFIKNNESQEIFLAEEFIKLFKKNGIDHVILPYTMKKTELDKIIYNLDGLLFPGSQLGNFYNNKYIQKHFRIQKYLIQKAKTINNNKRPFPIIGMCHGYENMILAEKNYNITNKNIKKVFINVEAYPNYKTNPTFIKTKLGNSFKKNFHRTKKLINNHSLAVESKNKIGDSLAVESKNKIGDSLAVESKNKIGDSLAVESKNKIGDYIIIATSLDKNNKAFIEIIKHKTYPFFGFQGHPERSSQEMINPFLSVVKNSFRKRNKTRKVNIKILESRRVLCRKYNLANKTSKRKCLFYKV